MAIGRSKGDALIQHCCGLLSHDVPGARLEGVHPIPAFLVPVWAILLTTAKAVGEALLPYAVLVDQTSLTPFYVEVSDALPI